MKKILLIILDGAGDRPCEELGGKTPLDAANTPHLDSIVKDGRIGLVQLMKENFATETDSGALSILGYDVQKYYTGRGPLEALGAGIKMDAGDIAMRVNFGTAKDGKISNRRVSRTLSDKEAEILVKDINSNIKLTSIPADFELRTLGGGYRCCLVIRKLDGVLSANVSNTDPGYKKSGAFSIPEEEYSLTLKECEPLDDSKEAKESAILINEFVEKVSKLLDEHWINRKRIELGDIPANIMLIRDCGDHLPILPTLEAKFKAKFGFAAEVFVEQGIAQLTGGRIIDIGRYSKDYTSDYPHYAKTIIDSMEDLDVIYIHIKGPDDPGHDGDPVRKKKIIETIDEFFFGNLLPHLDLDETIITVTSDHATPCSLKTHSADPVPVAIIGGGIHADDQDRFHEKCAENGSLEKMFGVELMPLLIKRAQGRRIPHTYLKNNR